MTIDMEETTTANDHLPPQPLVGQNEAPETELPPIPQEALEAAPTQDDFQLEFADVGQNQSGSLESTAKDSDVLEMGFQEEMSSSGGSEQQENGGEASRSLDSEVSIDLGEIARMIPNKMAFKIGEVAEITNLKPYVLRYWESEFEALNPQKSAFNQRMYTRRDVETVLLIKKLLYEEKFSIAGAKRKLKELRRELKTEKQWLEINEKLELASDRVAELVEELGQLKRLFT